MSLPVKLPKNVRKQKFSLGLRVYPKNMQTNPNKSLMESYLEPGELSLDLGDLGPQAVTSSEDFVLDLDLDEIIETSAITA